jgi:hypothetical protein
MKVHFIILDVKVKLLRPPALKPVELGPRMYSRGVLETACTRCSGSAEKKSPSNSVMWSQVQFPEEAFFWRDVMQAVFLFGTRTVSVNTTQGQTCRSEVI